MELAIWNILWELLKNLAYKWHTHLSCVYSGLLIVAGGIIFGFNADLNSKERFHFSCYKSEKPQQDECQVAYDTGPNILHNSFIIPGVQFLLPVILLLTRFVFMKISSERNRNLCGKTVHMYAVHFFEIAVRFIFFLVMIVVFAEFADHLIVKGNFYCILDVKQNQSAPFRCTDVKADAKTALNVLSFVLNIILCLLSFCECYWLLRKLHNNWFLLPDSAGACARCAQFQKLLIDFDGSSEPQQSDATHITVYGGNVSIGDRRTFHEADTREAPQPGSSTEDSLQSSSKKLKDKYKRMYQNHTITCVNGTELEEKEVDLEKFAVEVTLLREREVKGLSNERSEYISQWNAIRCQDSVAFTELVNRSSEERVAFVRGVAGIGKTILAKQIALNWAKDEKFQEFTHLCVLECRSLNDETSLDDLLKRDFFGDSVPEGCKILFIIDGIDEVDNLKTKLNDKRSIMYQLLDKYSDRYVGSKVILTGRPHVQTTLKSNVPLIGNMKIFEIAGLSDESIEDYIKLFTEEESEMDAIQKEDAIQKKKDAIQKTRKDSKNINAVMSIPQYLNTLCCVAILTGGAAISNTTELYVWLFYIFFLSHIEKSKGDFEIKTIFSNHFNFIKLFGKVSYELLLKKTIVFSEKDFAKELKELQGNDEIKKVFDVFCVDIGVQKGVRKFQFKHLTLQEFFASMYCFIERIDAKTLIQNENYEIAGFICGFYGVKLETETEDEDSMLENFVKLGLEINEEREDKEGKFLLDVLGALKDKEEGERIRVRRGISFILESLSNGSKYCKQEIVRRIIETLIGLASRDAASKGLNRFIFVSTTDQMNLSQLIEIAENNDVCDAFKNVYLELSPLSLFSLFTYFKYFGYIHVRVYSSDVVQLKCLFNNCLYCNEVDLRDCKLVGVNYDLELVREGLVNGGDRVRLELLALVQCEMDDGNWEKIAAIIPVVERVVLLGMKMEEARWERMVEMIEEGKQRGQLTLKKLILFYCNIDDQLEERMEAAGVSVEVHRY